MQTLPSFEYVPTRPRPDTVVASVIEYYLKFDTRICPAGFYVDE
jgi:hypothetical protein